MRPFLAGQSRRAFLPLAVVCLLVVSGCSGAFYTPGAEQATPPAVVLNNTANTTHTFSVWAVEGTVGVDGLRTVPRDDDPSDITHTEGLLTVHYSEEARYIEAVEPPPDRSRLVADISLQGNTTHRQQVVNFSHGDTLIVTAAENDRIFELVVVNCGRHPLVGLEVMTRPEPSAAASYGCQ